MRITGGVYCGRRIKCPPGEIRPAMDRMRESLFSILNDISGLSFLDLFTGSGIVGIEAASRGAEPVVMVEKDYRKKTVIRENLGFVAEEVRLILQPVERFINACRDTFDLIYADPPFRYAFKTNLLEKLSEAGLLKPAGRLIIHHPRKESLEVQPGKFQLYDERTYGGSILKFYRYAKENAV